MQVIFTFIIMTMAILCLVPLYDFISRHFVKYGDDFTKSLSEEQDGTIFILEGLDKYLQAILNDKAAGYYAGRTLCLDTKWGHLMIPSTCVLDDQPNGWVAGNEDQFKINFKLTSEQKILAAKVYLKAGLKGAAEEMRRVAGL